MLPGGFKRAGVGIKACPRDYLSIPGTIQSEETSQSGESNDRYCGSKFSDRPADFRHRVVLGIDLSQLSLL